MEYTLKLTKEEIMTIAKGLQRLQHPLIDKLQIQIDAQPEIPDAQPIKESEQPVQEGDPAKE